MGSLFVNPKRSAPTDETKTIAKSTVTLNQPILTQRFPFHHEVLMSGIENKKTKQTILRSLAYAQFEHSMDLESRHYWNTICAIDYAHKWWNSIPSANHPAVLHDASGDNKDPFRRVPCPQDSIWRP